VRVFSASDLWEGNTGHKRESLYPFHSIIINPTGEVAGKSPSRRLILAHSYDASLPELIFAEQMSLMVVKCVEGTAFYGYNEMGLMGLTNPIRYAFK
jgi:hypothetical protein